jgi:hypothetical protein
MPLRRTILDSQDLIINDPLLHKYSDTANDLTTTEVFDDELKLDIGAGEMWHLETLLLFRGPFASGSALANLNLADDMDSGWLTIHGFDDNNNTWANPSLNLSSGNSASTYHLTVFGNPGGAGQTGAVWGHAMFRNGPTPFTLQVSWHAENASLSPYSLLMGSHIWARKLA